MLNEYPATIMQQSSDGDARENKIPLDELRRRADQGDTEAQHELNQRTLKRCREVAEQGSRVAQDHLGDLYYFGYGVPQDYTEAVRWYRKAAEQGEYYAQKSLSDCYYYGKGVAQDNAEAYKWISLTGVSEEIDLLARHMSPEQIAEGERRASQFVKRGK